MLRASNLALEEEHILARGLIVTQSGSYHLWKTLTLKKYSLLAQVKRFFKSAHPPKTKIIDFL